MRNSLGLLAATVLLAVVFVVPPDRARAQDAHHSDQGTEFAMEASTPEQRQGRMNQNMMKTMSEMKAADAKLETLVQAMNTAKGAEKTDVIAAVVTALVEQHRAMHVSMGMMMNMMNMTKKVDPPVSTEVG